jgi:hypothetical protein
MREPTTSAEGSYNQQSHVVQESRADPVSNESEPCATLDTIRSDSSNRASYVADVTLLNAVIDLLFDFIMLLWCEFLVFGVIC